MSSPVSAPFWLVTPGLGFEHSSTLSTPDAPALQPRWPPQPQQPAHSSVNMVKAQCPPPPRSPPPWPPRLHKQHIPSSRCSSLPSRCDPCFLSSPHPNFQSMEHPVAPLKPKPPTSPPHSQPSFLTWASAVAASLLHPCPPNNVSPTGPQPSSEKALRSLLACLKSSHTPQCSG